MILYVDPRNEPPHTIRSKGRLAGKSTRNDPVDDRGATGRVIGSISWTIDQDNRERERAGASCQTSPPVRVANAGRAFIDAFPNRSARSLARENRPRPIAQMFTKESI